MLENIKLLIGLTDNSKDAILIALIEQAIEEATVYTNNNDIDDLSSCIARMVIYNYNRIGTEGVSSEGYSGVSFNYTTDYPDNIVRMLKAKRKAKIV